jgi:DNA polymerase IV
MSNFVAPSERNIQEDRRIAHLDMDAFYASVELLRRPKLRGRPIVIAGRQPKVLRIDPGMRGVTTTANYEARKYGVRSAMSLAEVAQRCPDCLVVPIDFDEYRRLSRMFKAVIRSFTSQMEDRGIDEVYLDLSEVAGVEAQRGLVLAQNIKQAVFDATGLTCSIGLSPNKLISKIASDLEKPNGLTLIEARDIPDKIWPLAANKINGVGPKANERLANLGIASIGQLAQQPLDLLIEHFGRNYGQWLFDSARGIDTREVVTFSEPKSRSEETTFDRKLHPQRDWGQIARIISAQAESVARGLDRRQYLAKTVGVKVRFDDFRIVTRDVSMREPNADPVMFRRAASEALARVALERPVRLLGVRASQLEHSGQRHKTSPEPVVNPTSAEPNANLEKSDGRDTTGDLFA